MNDVNEPITEPHITTEPITTEPIIEPHTTTAEKKTKIKHIVISGGGPAGLLTYGAARYLAKEGFWCLADIASIYGCSIGAYMGVIISLGYEWDWLDDYFIKRPWDKVMSFSFIEAFDQKGLLGEKFLTDSLAPLLSAKDLNSNITFKELYAYNSIDLHIYTTNINTYHFEKVDMSHSTHPDLPLIKALGMSMAYPFAFKPVFSGEDCFIDGGLLNNYPLNDCITQTKCNKDEILAFKNIWILEHCKVTEESTVIDFLLVLMRKMQRSIDTEPNQEEVKHTVRCLIEDLDGFPAWIKALATEDMRGKLIDRGSSQAKLFLDYLK
jgi:predicted acylesterase/phospholipase RssA